MKELFQDFVTRVAYRKFLLVVAAGATFIANKQYAAAASVVLGYFGVNFADKKFNG
jgi:hypothetical protein